MSQDVRKRPLRVVLSFLVGAVLIVSMLQVYRFEPLPVHHAGPDVLHEFVQQKTPIAAQSRRTVSSSSSQRNYTQKLLDFFELHHVQLSDTERTDLQNLKWNYGDPVVYANGCDEFRQNVPEPDRIVAVAGMFNTGTNAMESALRQNIHTQHKWQVPWGKHRMASVRTTHRASGMEDVIIDHVLPIIMIRDPLSWMQSMCKSPYATNWKHSKNHCPNLVMTDDDRKKFQHITNFSVSVFFDKNSKFYWDSLVHLYNDWYSQYLTDATYPRMIVRFEDMLMHPDFVLSQIADCVNTTLPDTLKLSTKQAKSHGSGTDLLRAIFKTADASRRMKSLTSDDLHYAETFLNDTLMHLFRYHV